MLYASKVHIAVYQLLDGVLAGSAAPPGARAGIHSIIDELRYASASREMVTMTERISLLIHQLESALSSRDLASELAAREGLKDTAASWLNYRILY